MRTTLRRGVALGGLAACGAALAGCGGPSGIPTDASVRDFCAAGGAFATTSEFSQGVKAAARLHDTGTPDGIPDDARHGFELVVDLVTTARDKADLEQRYQELSAKQKKSIEALDGYISENC